MIRAWMTGALLPPPRHFFSIVDILHDVEPDSAALRDPLEDQPPGKRPPTG
jgi:hypothetical protein